MTSLYWVFLEPAKDWNAVRANDRGKLCSFEERNQANPSPSPTLWRYQRAAAKNNNRMFNRTLHHHSVLGPNFLSIKLLTDFILAENHSYIYFWTIERHSRFMNFWVFIFLFIAWTLFLAILSKSLCRSRWIRCGRAIWTGRDEKTTYTKVACQRSIFKARVIILLKHCYFCETDHKKLGKVRMRKIQS